MSNHLHLQLQSAPGPVNPSPQQFWRISSSSRARYWGGGWSELQELTHRVRTLEDAVQSTREERVADPAQAIREEGKREKDSEVMAMNRNVDSLRREKGEGIRNAPHSTLYRHHYSLPLLLAHLPILARLLNDTRLAKPGWGERWRAEGGRGGTRTTTRRGASETCLVHGNGGGRSGQHEHCWNESALEQKPTSASSASARHLRQNETTQNETLQSTSSPFSSSRRTTTRTEWSEGWVSSAFCYVPHPSR